MKEGMARDHSPEAEKHITDERREDPGIRLGQQDAEDHHLAGRARSGRSSRARSGPTAGPEQTPERVEHGTDRDQGRAVVGQHGVRATDRRQPDFLQQFDWKAMMVMPAAAPKKKTSQITRNWPVFRYRGNGLRPGGLRRGPSRLPGRSGMADWPAGGSRESGWRRRSARARRRRATGHRRPGHQYRGQPLGQQERPHPEPP